MTSAGSHMRVGVSVGVRLALIRTRIASPRDLVMDRTEIAPVDEMIVTVRGQRVILADDLARVYGVETRVLNQAVRRNLERFPHDFMFQITRDEAGSVQRLRSQSVILKRGQHLKYLPLAFTEHGAIMAATVLNSSRAVQMSVAVVRAFVRQRLALALREELTAKVEELERKVMSHDEGIRTLFEAIRQLMDTTPPPKRKPIGFHVKEAGPIYRIRRARPAK